MSKEIKFNHNSNSLLEALDITENESSEIQETFRTLYAGGKQRSSKSKVIESMFKNITDCNIQKAFVLGTLVGGVDLLHKLDDEKVLNQDKFDSLSDRTQQEVELTSKDKNPEELLDSLIVIDSTTLKKILLSDGDEF